MIYLDKNSDNSFYDVQDTSDGVVVMYSELGDWTDKFKGEVGISVSETDDDLIHVITKQSGEQIELNVCELIELYFALDYLYTYSPKESVNGINRVQKLKFMEVK